MIANSKTQKAKRNGSANVSCPRSKVEVEEKKERAHHGARELVWTEMDGDMCASAGRFVCQWWKRRDACMELW